MTTALFETVETWTTAMVTAHRKLPKDCPDWPGETPDSPGVNLAQAVAIRLAKLRGDFGTENAITGMAIGGDTVFADAVLELGLPLTAAVPFPGQPDDEYGPKWSRAQKQHWAELLERASHVEYVSPVNPLSYTERVRMLHARNDWMLKRSQVVLAIWAPGNKKGSGTYSCIVKAVSAGKPVIWFNLAAKTVTRPSPQRWARLLDRPALATARRSHA